MRLIILSSWIIIFSLPLRGQETGTFENWLNNKEGYKIQPYVMLQSWASYSHGQLIYNEDSAQYEQVDNRVNVQMRRMRFGFKGQPYEFLKFNMMAAYDLLGRDVLAATRGGAAPKFSILDVQINTRLLPKKEWLWLTAGYFRPQFSRESITSAWSVNSLEKALSQGYIRKHLVGLSQGRAAGLNLGGLWQNKQDDFGFQYNLGVFNPLYTSTTGNTVGSQFAPLIVARIALQLGDAEQEKYKLGYKINYFKERKGLSLAFSGAHQGKTLLFDQSSALGADLLLNYGPLNLDGEWNGMWRLSSSLYSFSMSGHARIGWNVIVAEKYFLEPVLKIDFFQGAMEAEHQNASQELGHSAGLDYSLEAGLNYYLNKRKLKLALFYSWQGGDAGAAGPGATANSYLSQSGAGAILRGNYVGLGVNLML